MADVLWVRLDGAALQYPVFMCAVYLPPVGNEFTCSELCTNTLCRRSHVNSGLEVVVSLAKEKSRQGDVIVAGDFNARAGADRSPRWELIQQYMQQAGLECVNPVDSAGELLPTRCGADGVLSILDLVLVASPSQQMHPTVHLDEAAAISDHFPLIIDYHPAQRLPSAQMDFPPNYGFTSGLPHHVRSRLAMSTVQEAEQWEEYKRLMVQQCEQLVVNSASDTVQQLEVAVLEAGRTAGVIAKANRVPVELKEASHIQRRIETTKRRMELALRVAGTTRKNKAALELLQSQLGQLEAARAAQLTNRRRAQRARRRVKRQQRQQDLDALWTLNSQAALAQGRATLARGQLSSKQRRHHTPLSVLQSKLWKLETGLRSKYHQVFAEEEGQRFEECECVREVQEKVQFGNGVSADQQREQTLRCGPTPEEIVRGLSKLSNMASTIGIPNTALRTLREVPVVLRKLTELFAFVWQSGEVPAQFCVVRAQLIHKAGPADLFASYRVIGIGSALSRLFQVIVNQRLQQQVEATMSPSQYGFLRGKATELCVFLAESATMCAQLDGNMVDTVLLDIAGAFPTTRHSVLLKRLEERGVDVTTRQLLRSWFSQQCIFTQIGRLTSNLVPVTLGTTEGAVFSPILFTVTADIALHNVQHHLEAAGLEMGLRLVLDTLRQLFYADDGRLFAKTQAAMQAKVTCMATGLGKLHYKLNAAPTKSAWLRRRPVGRAPRGAAEAQPPLYTLPDGTALPEVTEYKYLGVMVSSRGPRGNREAQLRHLAPKLAMMQRQASSSSLRRVSLLHGLNVYRTHWAPQMMYAAGLLWSTVPPQFSVTETRILKTMMSAPQHPDVVLRSIIGLPTLQTRIDVDRLRVLLRLLGCPPGSQVRQQLAVEVETWIRIRSANLWWADTAQLLQVMDSHTTPSIRAKHDVCPPSWLEWATMQAVDFMNATPAVEKLLKAGKAVLLELENDRRGRELRRCAVSLEEVWDLLDTPNTAPFTVDVRREATEHRVSLRGGVRTWFGHQYRHVACCPWCGVVDGFTVPHLVRDCVAFSEQRRIVWAKAKEVAIAAGVCVDHEVTAQAHNWYHLTCGAAVPTQFLRLQLESPSHFARVEQSATSHLRRHLQIYRRLLHITGQLLLFVHHMTAVQLQERANQLPQRPPRNKRQAAINHWTYEKTQLQLAARQATARHSGPPESAAQAVPAGATFPAVAALSSPAISPPQPDHAQLEVQHVQQHTDLQRLQEVWDRMRFQVPRAAAAPAGADGNHEEASDGDDEEWEVLLDDMIALTAQQEAEDNE